MALEIQIPLGGGWAFELHQQSWHVISERNMSIGLAALSGTFSSAALCPTLLKMSTHKGS